MLSSGSSYYLHHGTDKKRMFMMYKNKRKFHNKNFQRIQNFAKNTLSRILNMFRQGNIKEISKMKLFCAA